MLKSLTTNTLRFTILGTLMPFKYPIMPGIPPPAATGCNKNFLFKYNILKESFKKPMQKTKQKQIFTYIKDKNFTSQ